MNKIKNIQTTGEVIEIIEVDKKPRVKILMNSFYIDLLMNEKFELHLGEKVEINSKLKIKNITPLLKVNEENFN